MKRARNRNLRIAGRCLAGVVLVAALGVSGFVLNLVVHHNFHVVSPGRIYRSCQMSPAALTRTIRENGIRSIVDLRGDSGGDHAAEAKAAADLGVRHFDFELSATCEVSNEEMDRILGALSTAPKPVLIHCKSGADRTGLVSALYLYRLEGRSAGDASRQLALRYGHVPYLFWYDTAAMDRSFWRYVSNHADRAGLQLSASAAAPAANRVDSTAPDSSRASDR